MLQDVLVLSCSGGGEDGGGGEGGYSQLYSAPKQERTLLKFF